jgi:hypothetical protein
MHWTIALSSLTVTTICGFASVGMAQSEGVTPSPAQLLGVQERSIQNDFKTSRSVTSLEPSSSNRVAHPNGRVLYQIDRNTRVLIGPATGTTSTTELPTQSQQGDNRLQLLHDLEQ